MHLNYETNIGPIGPLMALVRTPSTAYSRLLLTATFTRICACFHRIAGVPQVHHFGQEGLHNVLVIDLLGPNLEDLFDMCGRKFTIKTVCMAAKQMVSIFCVVVDYVTCICLMA
jgi:hypothetical protein